MQWNLAYFYNGFYISFYDIYKGRHILFISVFFDYSFTYYYAEISIIKVYLRNPEAFLITRPACIGYIN